MHQINWNEIFAALLVLWLFIKKWVNNISKIVGPLIEEVELMAQDSQIDKADRKAIVMKAIALLEAQKSLKLNFISRFIVSKVVDRIAGKLPDYNISQDAQALLKKAKDE